MKKVNKRGFTLIEMLGAVAILGIIATIGVVSVSKVIASAHQKFDNTQYDSFLQAAETYFSDNKSRLPLTPMEWKEITLQELINKKYIEKLLDSNKQEFDYARSKVVVTRLTSGKYQYEAILYRKKGNPIGKISNKVTNQNSNITFKLRDQNKYYKENKTYYIRDYPVIDIGISDTDQLSGYQYIIYKNGKQFKKSENIEVSGGISVNEAVTLGKEFPFGKYSIKVVAYDKSGNKTTNSTDNSGNPDGGFTIYIDRIKPNCAITIDGTIGDNGWYKEKDISLTLKESDKESGILKHDMQTSKSFSSLGTLNSLTTLVKKQSDTGNTTWYAHVEDKAGNVCETEVNVKVDTKKPKCEVVSNTSTEKINTTEWYNKYSYYKIEQLKLNQSDEGPSGINRHILEMNTSNLSTTYKTHNDNDYIITEEGEHNYNGYVRDYAGNDVNCSTFIRKDTIDPECPSIFYVEYHSYNIPMVFISPDITFNWLNFSKDTVYAEAYVQESGSPLPYNYGVYYGSAVYTIAGKVNFTGYYTTELVAYDQAKNDKHCRSAGTEPAKEPEPTICQIVDGKYYDKEGQPVSEEEYNVSCGILSCQIVDGKYYEKHGQQVSEEEYNVSCGIRSCQVIDGKYYEQNGQQVSEAEYKLSCGINDPDPLLFKCVNVLGRYYDKDGNRVSKEEYQKSCDISPELECPKITSTATPGKWTDKTVTIQFSDVVSSAGSYDWLTAVDGSGKWTEEEYRTPITSKSFKTKITGEGKKKGRLILYDKNDQSKKITCATDIYWIDKKQPTCTVDVSPEPKDGCHGYYGVDQNIKVKATCKDGEGSGCTDKTVTQTVKGSEYKNKAENIEVQFQISDKSGKVGFCKKTIKIDGKGPKIESWSKELGSGYCGDPPQPFKWVVHPHISDEHSGYAGGDWWWNQGQKHNYVTRNNLRTNIGCIGSSVFNFAEQSIRWNLHDCVGNKASGSKSNFSTVHTDK